MSEIIYDTDGTAREQSSGKFAATRRPQPTTGLPMGSEEPTAEQYNEGATFHYPPVPRDPEQMIAFWDRVSVPDETLTTLRDAYEHRGRMLVQDELERSGENEWLVNEYYAQHYPDQQVPWEQLNDTERAERMRIADDFVQVRAPQILARLNEDVPMPTQIKATDARPLARAAQLYAQFQDAPSHWSNEDDDAVLGHQVLLSDGPATVEQIEARYRLWDLRRTLQTPPPSMSQLIESFTRQGRRS